MTLPVLAFTRTTASSSKTSVAPSRGTESDTTQTGREFRPCAIQQSEATRPPAAPGVDVCAGLEQHVQHFAARDIRNRRRIERADRLVELCFELRKTLQQPPQSWRVVRMKRLLQEFQRLAGFDHR